MVFELKILFHDEVAIQQINTYELMNYYLHLSYGYSIRIIENRNVNI
jgi:hypothetical protein